SSDIEHGAFHVVHKLPDRPLLPELIIVLMIHNLLPVTTEDSSLHFFQRYHPEEELVTIDWAIIGTIIRFGLRIRNRWRQLRRATSGTKAGVEPEIGGQHKCAIVIDVIAQVVIRCWRLRGSRDQRWMRIDYAGRNMKSGL